MMGSGKTLFPSTLTVIRVTLSLDREMGSGKILFPSTLTIIRVGLSLADREAPAEDGWVFDLDKRS